MPIHILEVVRIDLGALEPVDLGRIHVRKIQTRTFLPGVRTDALEILAVDVPSGDESNISLRRGGDHEVFIRKTDISSGDNLHVGRKNPAAQPAPLEVRRC